MRSLSLRRAAVAAALLSADGFFAAYFVSGPRWLFSPLDPWLSRSWALREVSERWITGGLVLSLLLTALALLAFGARMVARQHVRAGGADPLERVRAWVARRRRTVRAFYAVAALLSVSLRTLGYAFDALIGVYPDPIEGAVLLVGGVVLPMVAVVLALRAFGRVALSPLVDPAELERKDAGGLHFSAVAVTPESRAAVGLFALVTLGTLVWTVGTPVASASSMLLVALGYGATALLSAAAFTGASRIALGLDGVRVSGTSRPRFHAYRELDGVEVSRTGDVLLMQAGRVLLRLQLHGEDAARREPIVARLREAIARAHAPAAAAHRLAESASPAALAQAARGDGDYRSPAASRDALWEVVEAPSASGEARARAARALSAAADGADRKRLRFAAEHCADPPTRRALLRIAVGGEEEEEEPVEEAPALRHLSEPRP